MIRNINTSTLRSPLIPSKVGLMLCSTALLMALANFWLLLRPVARSEPPQSPITSVRSAMKGLVINHDLPKPRPQVPFAWAPLESSDYKTYIANLRKLSFPEELIHEMVISDVNKLYASREQPLKIKQAPHDAPLSERRRPPTEEDVKNLTQLRDIEIEKQGVLEDLLGVRVPRELLRTPNSRNYEGREYAISLLPPEKQEAVQRAEENEFLQDDLNQAQFPSGPEKLEHYRQIDGTLHAALQQILTPAEYDKYLMNTMPAGTEMARRTIGMQATDEEMLKMWHLSQEQWTAQGGVYGWWRAEPISPEQIKQNDADVDAGMKAALGGDRYLDYKMALSETGQQMRNFAARYELPRETLTQAFSVQTEMDKLSRGEASPEQLERRRTLMEQMQTLLGPDLLRSWNAGRRMVYDLQP